MPHKIGYVDNNASQYLPWTLAHYNMLALIRRFALGYGDVTTPQFSGTGNGTMTDVDALPAAVSETWTVTCKTKVENGGVFSVTGSVSGAKADATVGTAYDNSLVQFKINDGTTDFEVNDEFTFDSVQSHVSAKGENWIQLRYDTSQENHELILKGLGQSREEEIIVGFRTYHNAGADYYNLLAMACTGYIPENGFDYQANTILSGIPAHNQRIDYWISLNGQKIALCMRVGGTTYESAYLGKILPYTTPDKYPYPVVCAGMLEGAEAKRYSETTHRMPYQGRYVITTASGFDCSIFLLDNNGSWTRMSCWPYTGGGRWLTGDQRHLRDTGGYYHLLPVELWDGYSDTSYVLKNCNNIYGALDGIYFITGFNNAAENTIVIDGVTYVVFQNVGRTGFADYYAMKLEPNS